MKRQGFLAFPLGLLAFAISVGTSQAQLFTQWTNGWDQPCWTSCGSGTGLTLEWGSDVPNGTTVTFDLYAGGHGHSGFQATKGDVAPVLYGGSHNFNNPGSGGDTVTCGNGNHVNGGPYACNVTGGVLTYTTSTSAGPGWNDKAIVATIKIGSGFTCSTPTTVTGHWVNGSPDVAHAVVNVLVGGMLFQIDCDAHGCNSGSATGQALSAVNGGSGPWDVSYSVNPGSYDIDKTNHQYTPTASGPSSISCGGSIDFLLDSKIVTSTPTPSPGATVTPTVSPSPSVIPSPNPSIAPPPYTTPGPYSSAPPGMPNAGGTPTTTDIYNAVKQALIDAGNSGLGQFAAGTDVNGSGVDVGNSNGTYGTGAGNGTDVNPAQGVDDDVVSTRNTAESRISTTVFSISAMPTPALPVPATGCYTYDTSFDWPSATGSVHQAVHWDWTRHASQIGLIRNGCSFAISIMGLFWIISIIRSAIA